MISWTTGGDGNFTDPTVPNPTYNFGTNDKKGGAVTLTITVSNGTCTPATSTFTLNIDSVPYAAPGAISSDRVCASTLSYNVPAYNYGPHGTQVGLISWTSSGDGNFVDNTVPNPTYNFGTNDQTGGVVTLTMSVTNGACTIPATATFTLTIDSVPSAIQGSPSSDQVCASVGSYTIPPSYGYGYGPTTGLSTGVISWSASSNGTITNGNTLSPTYTLSTLDSINGGTVTLTMSVTNGTCTTPATTTFDLGIYPFPYDTVGPPQDICASSVSQPLGGNTSQYGTGLWTQVNGPVGGITTFVNGGSSQPANTLGNSSAGVSSAGQYVYAWTITTGPGCSLTKYDTVTFHTPPTTAHVGPNQTICGSLVSNPLGGNNPTIGNGKWSLSSGPGTVVFNITGVDTGNATATVSTPGLYTFLWTIKNGNVCTPSTDSLKVNYLATPTGGTIPTVTYCSSADSATVTITGVSNATQYAWNLPAGLTGYSTSSAITVGGTVGGNYTVTATPYNTTCPGTPITGTVTIIALPTTATVGATQNLCGTLTSGSLGGNTPTVGTGAWTQTSGPGTSTFSNSTSGSSTATATVAGTYTYTWTISNGICAPSAATTTVVYVPAPSGGSIAAVSYCSSADSATVSVTGVSNATQYTWALPAGLSGYSTSSSITVGGTVGGTYIVTVTPYNGTCVGTPVTGTVTIVPVPTTATVGATQNLCGTLTSGSLGGNTPTIGTGAWTQTSGPGTSTFSNSTSGSSTATATVAGTYTYTWTISNGICAPSAATTTVVYVPAPSGGSIAAVSYCSSADSATVSVTGVSNATQYTWALPAGLSGYSTSSSITVGGTVGGTYIVTVTPYNGTCVGTPVTGTVTIIDVPTTATVGATQNLCGTLTSGSLGGNTPSVGTGAWTQASGPGTSTFSNSTLGSSTATATVPGTYTYTWTISNGICAPSTATTTVVYVPAPSGGSIATVSYCSSADSATVSVTGVSNATQYTWALPAGLSGTSTTANITVGGTVAGTYIVTVTPYNGACVGTPVTGTVTIIALPTPATVGATQNLCGVLTSGSLGGNTPSVGTGAWTQSSGPGTTTFSNATLGSSTATATVSGTYTYTWTISNGICAPSAATVTVNFQLAPTGGTIAPVVYCSSTDTATVTVAGVSNATQYTWALPAGLSGTSTSASILVGGTVPGVYTVTVTPHNIGATTCSGTPITGTVTIEALPVIDSVVAVGPACVGASTGSITVYATSSNGSLTYSINGGVSYPSSTGIFTNIATGSYSVYVKDAGTCKAAYAANPIVIIKPLNGLVVTDAETDAKCNGADNGSILLQPSGGGGAYTFKWSNGDTTQFISGLAAGTYVATITDARGCSVTLRDTVFAPNVLTDTILAVNLSCTGTSNGSATVVVSGGTAPYSYLWSNFATTDSIGGLDAGVYNVLITDANGCRGAGSVTINGSGHLTANLTAGPDVVLSGELVHLYANAVSDTTILSYVWTPVDSLNFDSCGGTPTSCGSPTATPSVTQDYSVVVTDAHGCSVTSSVNVTVSQVPLQFMPTAFTPNGDGLNDFFTFDILGAKSVNVQVWNRWGEQVYSLGNATNGTPTWDGTYKGQPAQIDTYTYQLDVTYFTGVRKTIAGTILLEK